MIAAVIPLNSVHALEHLTETRVSQSLRSTAWFASSFIGTAFAILLVYSGGEYIVVTIGESIASLLPGTLLTPVWAAMIYLSIRIALPAEDLGRSSATAIISGSMSLLLLAFGYYRYLIPYLARLSNTTEFEKDTWTQFYLALIVCIVIASTIEYLFVANFPLRQTRLADDSTD